MTRRSPCPFPIPPFDMSTLLPRASLVMPVPPAASSPALPPDAARPATATLTGSWWREPLLHFVLLGGLLFGVDHRVNQATDDPRHIVFDRAADQEARQVFKASRGRLPDATELQALRQVWLDNEVLYREGLALQVDKGDTAIRERVIFKALSVIDANTERPPIDDARLREWFESHRERYDEPPRFDFQEAVLAQDNSEAAVRRFVAALQAGTPGDAQAGLRVFKGRPHSNLVQSYGAAFAARLESAQPGEWQAIDTGKGWRAMRLERVTPPRPADFATLRGVVLQDWTDAVMAEQRTAAVRALAGKYRITVEAGTP
jgi:hypothetical protein